MTIIEQEREYPDNQQKAILFYDYYSSNKSRWPSVIALPWGDEQDLRESTKQTRMDSLAKIRLIL